MSYLQRNNRDSKDTFKSVVKFISLFLVFIIAFDLIFPKFLPSFFFRLISPMWQNVSTANKDNLQKELEETKLELVKTRLLEEENKSLKEILGRVHSKNTILASVLKTPPYSPYDSLIVDIGEDYKVKTGDRVFASGDILIGYVTEIYANTAKVILFSSPGEKYDVVIGSTTNIHTTASGLGGGNFEINIPEGLDVKVDDPISIPSIWPITFGKVENIEKDPSRTFSKITFKNPVNMWQLRWVEIEIGK